MLALVRELALAQTTAVDPIAIAVFNLLGILPLAFLAILLFEAAKPSPWPFALGRFFLGGFVLLPYLVLRDSQVPLETVWKLFKAPVPRPLASSSTGERRRFGQYSAFGKPAKVA